MALEGAASLERSFWQKTLHFFRTRFVDPLIHSRSHPSVDARGVSTGLVIGLIIPVGGQLLFLALLRFAFRFNYMVAAAFTMVSNPLNMIPLYYGYYCLGSFILGKSVSLDFQIFKKMMNPIMEKEYFWGALSAFMTLGWEILIRWLAAAVVLSIFFGSLGYAVTYVVQRKRGMKTAEAKGLRWDEYLKELKQDKAGKKP
jgi:hypothetical protein